MPPADANSPCSQIIKSLTPRPDLILIISHKCLWAQSSNGVRPPTATPRHGDHGADLTDIRRPGEGRHGVEELSASGYSEKALDHWAVRIGPSSRRDPGIPCSTGKYREATVFGPFRRRIGTPRPRDSARLGQKFPSQPNRELNRPCREANSLKAAETGIDHLISEGAANRAMVTSRRNAAPGVDAHGSTPPGSDPGLIAGRDPGLCPGAGSAARFRPAPLRLSDAYIRVKIRT